MCRPIEEGGLGIKNCRAFNLTLLGKWFCRLKSDPDGLWQRILIKRYRLGGKGLGVGNGTRSTWWKDLIEIGEKNQIVEDSRVKAEVNKLGYIIKEAYKVLRTRTDAINSSNSNLARVWLKVIPTKVSILIWKMM